MDRNIFISYRLADSEGYAGRIYDRLQDCFGADRVFMDVTNIGVGENFGDAINQAIGTCRVVIVLIGPRWHSITDEMGRKRLDDPHDFVRVEVQAALGHDILIMPVLINGGHMPRSEDLPLDLRDFTLRDAIEIRHRRFDADVEHLVSELERILGESAGGDSEALMSKPTRRLLSPGWLLLISLIIGTLYLIVWFMERMEDSNSTTQFIDGTSVTAFAIVENLHTHTIAPWSPTLAPTEMPSVTPAPTNPNPPTLTSTSTAPSMQIGSSLPAQFVDAFGVSLVLVPQGPFILGTDGQEPWDLIAHPARLVSLDIFYIDQYEVSNAQYAACVLDGVCISPSNNGSKTRNSYFDNPAYADYPVVYVSWQDAQTYCAWRGGRLPSETEWEKAARGDKQFDYPWGDGPIDCQHANYWPENACEGDTFPVDRLPAGASPYGAMNMSGNVQEWVDDWFQAYPGGDPTATREFGITHRVIRGGAYFDGSNNIRTTSRKGLNPEAVHSYVGFRCVIDIEALP